ncbi:MAG TPA: hydrogenase maturation protease [Acidimicrobiales bacterium]|nr:hydrogenase maturation protease [Acidimicrobiales bacterium]
MNGPATVPPTTVPPPTVLVAGIGNIFFGDDGFGPAVAQTLGDWQLPPDVEVADFGIRGVHLAYQILEGGYRTVVLIDALPMGEAPGTLAVLEPEPGPASEPAAAASPVQLDAHSMSPAAVLSALRALGGVTPRVRVVGCQPADLECGMTLSEPVRRAVEAAADLVVDTVLDELAGAEAAGVEVG